MYLLIRNAKNDQKLERRNRGGRKSTVDSYLSSPISEILPLCQFNGIAYLSQGYGGKLWVIYQSPVKDATGLSENLGGLQDLDIDAVAESISAMTHSAFGSSDLRGLVDFS